jgi:two-component system, NarL family, nitrate/nitrite response regulator NarL
MSRSSAVLPATAKNMAKAAPPAAGPLRVAVVAADPTMARRLAALVEESGHDVVAASEPADALVSDGSAPPETGVPAVMFGAAAGDYAGLLPEHAAPVQLDAALRAVAAGLVVRPRAVAKPRFGPLSEETLPPLTAREIEVLTAFGEGLSNKETARRLGISPHTVKFHGESLFRKLGAGCRAEAVAKGLKRQIVEF